MPAIVMHIRDTHLAVSVEVGPSLQQQLHGIRLPAGTGPYQGRHSILEKLGGHAVQMEQRKCETYTIC
jgi:hypothetical protein